MDKNIKYPNVSGSFIRDPLTGELSENKPAQEVIEKKELEGEAAQKIISRARAKEI